MKSSRKYYDHIDGLRAFAVLSVLLYHANEKLLPGGFLGVDVFFIISGFVVSASVAKFSGSFFSFLGTFYSRRFIRILPALLVTLWVTTTFTILLIPWSWLSAANENVAKSAHIALSNLALLKEQANYFSPVAEYNPYTHTWSLAIEEQFYFIFPFLFFTWLKLSKNRFFVPVAIGIVSSISLYLALTKNDQSKVFYILTYRFWELGLGVILYQITQIEKFKSLVHWKGKFKNILTLVLFGLLLLSVGVPPVGIPNYYGLIAVFCTGLILFLLESDNSSIISKILSWRPLRFVGKISYSLYLFHWPVIVFLRWSIGIESIWTLPFTIGASFLLATLSYNYIESPFRNLKYSVSNPKIIFTGLAVVFLSYHLTKFAYKNKEHLSLSRTLSEIELWDPGRYPIKMNRCKVKDNYRSNGATEFKQVGDCPQKRFARKLFVIGDSHAGSYYSVYKKIALETGIYVWLNMRAGCAMVNFYRPIKAGPASCVDYLNQKTEEVLKVASKGDIVFFPALRVLRFGDHNGIIDPEVDIMMDPEVIKNRNDSIKEAPDWLKPFIDAELDIVFDAPPPLFRIEAFRCADWFTKSHPICKYGFSISREELLEYRAPVMDALKELTKLSENIHIWDPFDTLCPPSEDGMCHLFQEGKPIISDMDHLSGYGNYKLFDKAMEIVFPPSKKPNIKASVNQ